MGRVRSIDDGFVLGRFVGKQAEFGFGQTEFGFEVGYSVPSRGANSPAILRYFRIVSSSTFTPTYANSLAIWPAVGVRLASASCPKDDIARSIRTFRSVLVSRVLRPEGLAVLACRTSKFAITSSRSAIAASSCVCARSTSWRAVSSSSLSRVSA